MFGLMLCRRNQRVNYKNNLKDPMQSTLALQTPHVTIFQKGFIPAETTMGPKANYVGNGKENATKQKVGCAAGLKRRSQVTGNGSQITGHGLP